LDTQAHLPLNQAAADPPLVMLFRHNLWANLRLLDACAALDEEQLAATIPGTYNTIHKTLNHIVWSEEQYLSDLTGREPESRLWSAGGPVLVDVARLRAMAQQNGQGLMDVAAGAAAGEVVILEGDGLRWHTPVGLILTQAINHATEHRAQIMVILTQLGLEPPDVSGWAFSQEFVRPISIE